MSPVTGRLLMIGGLIRLLVLMLSVVLGLTVVFVWAQGGEQERITVWPGTDLKRVTATELAPMAKTPGQNGAMVGAKGLMNVPTHSVILARRENGGVPELHNGATDIFVVQDGGGVLQIGGEIVDRQNSANGATGTSIRGGENYKLSAGDVINIPPNVPHAWHLDPGQHVTYLVVKVKRPGRQGAAAAR